MMTTFFWLNANPDYDKNEDSKYNEEVSEFDFSYEVTKLPRDPMDGKLSYLMGKYPPTHKEYSVANKLVQDFNYFVSELGDKKYVYIDMSNNNLSFDDPEFIYTEHGQLIYMNMFKFICYLIENNCHILENYIVFLEFENNSLKYDQVEPYFNKLKDKLEANFTVSLKNNIKDDMGSKLWIWNVGV
jgi:hypothetical protein